MSASTLEILTKARALIEKPEAWTQGVLGRRVNGTPIVSARVLIEALQEKDVARMCALGACIAAEDSAVGKATHSLEIENALGLENIPKFNDGSTHAEVLRVFDSAIKKLRAAGDSTCA